MMSRFKLNILLISILFSSASYSNNLSSKLQEAKKFIKQKSMNTNYTILVDMSIHSGKNRLFVVDLKKDSLVLDGLCSHGCGSSGWGRDLTKENPVFSNTPDSHLSSLGKYKIGKRGYSQWGIHINYKLHGLEETNSNAYKRIIVLHSWKMVPNIELFPLGTPEGWGCPAVSNEHMKKIDKILQKQKEPVLLWIYN